MLEDEEIKFNLQILKKSLYTSIITSLLLDLYIFFNFKLDLLIKSVKFNIKYFLLLLVLMIPFLFSFTVYLIMKFWNLKKIKSNKNYDDD